MGRIVAFAGALALMGYLAYRQMYGGHLTDGAEKSAPKQRLENVQNAANRIEDQQQKNAEDALKKATAE